VLTSAYPITKLSGLKNNAFIRIFSLGVLGVLAVGFWTYYELREFRLFPPFEDAAMLFRYAENLATGEGITWNAGEHPGVTDGATDLGFVLVLAPLIRLGLPVEGAALLINTLAVFALGALVGLLSRRLLPLGYLASALIVLLVVNGPLQRYIPAGFSAPVMGAILLGLLVFTTALLSEASAKGMRTRFALLGLLAAAAGWWRPEGFATSLIVITATAFACQGKNSRFTLAELNLRKWIPFAISFFLGVLTWIAFRLLYFGQLLPTSAVTKGGGGSYHNFTNTLQFYFLLTLPIVAILVSTSLLKKNRAWVFLTTVTVGSFMWIPFTLAANWWERMQWPLVPALITLGVMIASRQRDQINTKDRIPSIQKGAVALTALGALFSLHVVQGVNFGYHVAQPHTNIATALERVDTSEVRLATSEAGLIPLAIEGRALDTFGLNNRSIAESGGESLQEELDRFQPNVLIVQGPTPTDITGKDCRDTDSVADDWRAMALKAFDYAAKTDMEVVRAIETGPCLSFLVFTSEETPLLVVEALTSFPAAGGSELVLDRPAR